MEELDRLENILLEHCYDMSILKKDSSRKKKDSILDSLIAAIVRSETSFEDVLSCINDVRDDKVIDLNVFKNGGNINNYINEKWLKLSKALYRQRSVGLGTPNAASGEGELMFIFLSNKIKKPTRGDLQIDDDNIELKGEAVRVNGKISGKTFRKRSLDICEKYGLSPNISNRTNLKAVEIEKQQHQEYWINELNKLSVENRILFVSDYLRAIDDGNIDDYNVFNGDQLDFDILRKTIVKILYKSMVNDRSFDKFVLLGDGSNIKILSSDINKFNKDVDSGIIEIGADYFRINQDSNIGWYIL
jgi:hypothetical protein